MKLRLLFVALECKLAAQSSRSKIVHAKTTSNYIKQLLKLFYWILIGTGKVSASYEYGVLASKSRSDELYFEQFWSYRLQIVGKDYSLDKISIAVSFALIRPLRVVNQTPENSSIARLDIMSCNELYNVLLLFHWDLAFERVVWAWLQRKRVF